MEKKERKTTHLDFQFTVIVYRKKDYDLDGDMASGDSKWSGQDFGNSWKESVGYAQRLVYKNPELLCVVSDRMRGKELIVSK